MALRPWKLSSIRTEALRRARSAPKNPAAQSLMSGPPAAADVVIVIIAAMRAPDGLQFSVPPTRADVAIVVITIPITVNDLIVVIAIPIGILVAHLGRLVPLGS